MICPNCQTINENDNLFCVNCGGKVMPTGSLIGDTKAPTESFQFPLPPPNDLSQGAVNTPPPTQFSANSTNIPPPTQFGQPQPPPTQIYTPANSMETSVVPVNQYNAQSSMNNFQPVITPAFAGAQAQVQQSSNKKIFIWTALIFLVIAAAGIGGFFLLTKNPIKTEVLPDHLGMFVQSVNKDKVEEIKKQDFTNALEGKDNLLKDDNLASAEGNPNLILYSDSKEVSPDNLRLIQLDTIKPDGSLKQLDFQAALIDGKPEMKRIRIPDGLANGKYAFAILDGHLDEGKHKFWAFQVKNSEKSNNDSTLKSTTVSLKPKETKPTPTTTQKPQTTTPIVPPSTNSYAYSTTDSLILRQSPSLSGYDTGVRIRKGQRVYIQSLSSHSDTWKGRTGKWAYITTDDGYAGWVFSPLLRY